MEKRGESLFKIAYFIFSFSLYGEELKPCETVGLEQVISFALPAAKGGMSSLTAQEVSSLVKLLKKCIHTSSVCIAESDRGSKNWVSSRLRAPKDGDFDPVERELILGLLQYIDKTSKEGLCIVVGNGFTQAIRWYGSSWVVTDEGIKRYEIASSQFTTVMTPSSLYNAMLVTHRKAVVNAKRNELEKEGKIEIAQKMLEEGSDPDFVAELTGISRKEIWLLQRLNN